MNDFYKKQDVSDTLYMISVRLVFLLFNNMHVMAGLYFHIPFCTQKCVYCDFLTGTNLSLRDCYVLAVKREMERYRDFFRTDGVRTVYFGGGTPSLFSSHELGGLIGAADAVWGLDGVEEMTVECNPDDITDEWLTAVKALGVNRLSIGVQSFDDEELRWMNRRHTAAEAYRAVLLARHAGFVNVSVDVIFGLPQQTVDSLSATIDRVLQLGVQHVSAYSLMVEPGSKLERLIDLGRESMKGDDECADMFALLSDRLLMAGFDQYEISNYALPGYESRHNSGYWHGVRYLGLGAGASSFDGVQRWKNIAHTLRYCNMIGRNEEVREVEIMTRDERFNETFFTALRTREGIDLETVSALFGDDCKAWLVSRAEKFVRNGLLQYQGSHLSLTRRGIYVSDMVMSDFMRV